MIASVRKKPKGGHFPLVIMLRLGSQNVMGRYLLRRTNIVGDFTFRVRRTVHNWGRGGGGLEKTPPNCDEIRK